MLTFAPGAGLLSILIVASVGFLLNRLVQSRIKRAADASKQATDRLVVVANNALAGVKTSSSHAGKALLRKISATSLVMLAVLRPSMLPGK